MAPAYTNWLILNGMFSFQQDRPHPMCCVSQKTLTLTSQWTTKLPIVTQLWYSNYIWQILYGLFAFQQDFNLIQCVTKTLLSLGGAQWPLDTDCSSWFLFLFLLVSETMKKTECIYRYLVLYKFAYQEFSMARSHTHRLRWVISIPARPGHSRGHIVPTRLAPRATLPLPAWPRQPSDQASKLCHIGHE